jgi:hypothetical protein
MEKEAVEGVFAQMKYQDARKNPEWCKRHKAKSYARADYQGSESQSGVAAMTPELAEHHRLRSNIARSESFANVPAACR